MASYVDITNTLNFSVSFKPTSAFPLDARSMFGSYAAAKAAAESAVNAGSSESIYYIGQQLTVFENDVVSTYLIQPDKTLKAIGANIISDNASISIGEDSTIAISNFGKRYYKYNNADTVLEGEYTYPDTMPADAVAGNYVKIGEVYYQYDGSAWAEASTSPSSVPYYTPVEGWKANLEPKVALTTEGGYEIAWYEPSATTVEGLQSTISGLQTNFDALAETVANNKADADGKIKAEEERATAAEDALAERVTKNETDIATLNGDVNTEGSVKYQVAEEIALIMNNGDEAMNSIQELVTWIENHGGDATKLQSDVVANATAIKALETLVGKLPEGTQATDVIGYIAEAVKAEETRALAAEAALAERVTNLESVSNNLGSAAEMDASAFATAAQGAKADTAVQSVVSGENGHILVDGVDTKVYEAPKASVTQAGDVMVDGTSITVTEEGVISILAVDAAKVTGLDTKLTTTKDAAVTEAKEYINENVVLKTDVVDKDTVAEDSATASAEKVVSEQLFLEAMTWKTEM